VNLLQNGNKTANINVEKFHRSLTTVRCWGLEWHL